jgi:hypothetical protein
MFNTHPSKSLKKTQTSGIKIQNGFSKKQKQHEKPPRAPAMIRSRDRHSKSSAETSQKECMKKGVSITLRADMRNHRSLSTSCCIVAFRGING